MRTQRRKPWRQKDFWPIDATMELTACLRRKARLYRSGGVGRPKGTFLCPVCRESRFRWDVSASGRASGTCYSFQCLRIDVDPD